MFCVPGSEMDLGVRAQRTCIFALSEVLAVAAGDGNEKGQNTMKLLELFIKACFLLHRFRPFFVSKEQLL